MDVVERFPGQSVTPVIMTPAGCYPVATTYGGVRFGSVSATDQVRYWHSSRSDVPSAMDMAPGIYRYRMALYPAPVDHWHIRVTGDSIFRGITPAESARIARLSRMRALTRARRR